MERFAKQCDDDDTAGSPRDIGKLKSVKHEKEAIRRFGSFSSDGPGDLAMS